MIGNNRSKDVKSESFGDWIRDSGVRLECSRTLDGFKVQAPAVVRLANGDFRLFYTAVGPARPYPTCQGYILSALSRDGLKFTPEPGIRLAPQIGVVYRSLRVIAPTIAWLENGSWRMYVEARGAFGQPTVICSAISSNMLDWVYEDGIRLQGFDGVGGCRYVAMPDGRGRLYCFANELRPAEGGQLQRFHNIVSAISTDGLQFEIEPGYRLRDIKTGLETAGITAAEVVAPASVGGLWRMVYSAWQDVAVGTVVPLHPSQDPDAESNGRSVDFAAASIVVDMAGYRSRIFTAFSEDGLKWHRGDCVIDGEGYNGAGVDAVHAEDMSLLEVGNGQYRMYYAACDAYGNWRIASAATAAWPET